MSYSAHINKSRKEQKQELVKSTADLDKRYALTPTAELYNEKSEMQTEFNLLSSKEAEQVLLKTRGILHEHREKAGRLLGLYADDLLLYISDPKRIIPHILNTLKTFALSLGLSSMYCR